VLLGLFVLTGCAPEQNPPTSDGEPAEVPAETYRPHPDCELTVVQLEEMVSTQPEAAQQRIMAEPAVFLEYARHLLQWEPPLLALVDKQTALPADYVPNDLISLPRYGDQLILNRDGLSLRAVIMPDVLAMVEAARQDGIQLDISSSYRSYTYQENLFQYWTNELGLEEAERVSARPGTSQHQLGTTVDFGSITPAFAQHPAGIWLAEHAGHYGFSLSYPDGYEAITGYSYEPWHFRWISRSGTFLEARFFGGVQQYFLEFWNQAETPIRNACTGGS